MNIFNKVLKVSIYLLVFLLPLFWLPFSFEAFEFNKQYLLFFLVSLTFLTWLAKMVLADKEIRFRRTPLDIPVLAFLFIAVLSAVFSIDRGASIFGFYGRFSDGLIGLLGLGVFYFLLTNLTSGTNGTATNGTNLTDEKISSGGLLRVFFGSVFFVILISYLSIFGVWQKIGQGLPQIMLQKIFNPVSGSLEGLAIFLAIIIVLLTGWLLSRGRQDGKLGTFFYYLLLISALGLLALIDLPSAWLIILIGLGIFFIFSLAKRLFKEDVNQLLLVILLLVISAAFLFLDTTDFSNSDIFNFQREQVLNQGTSWKVALGAATDNIKSGFLGSGIGTYHYDFAKFKPAEFNQSPLWQIRYDRAGSYLSELLATMGFLGLISYLALAAIFLLISWFLLGEIKPVSSAGKSELKEGNGMRLSLLVAFLALLAAQFFYYQNTVLAFTFWFVLGLAAVSLQKPHTLVSPKESNLPTGQAGELRGRPAQEKVLSFKNFPEINLVFSTLLVFLSLAVLVSYYFSAKFYLADVNYLKAQLTAISEERIKTLERVVEMNPKSAIYQVVLARAYWLQILQELDKPQSEIDIAKLQDGAAKAIDRAKKAAEISPNSVLSQETLGIIYRDIQPLAQGAADWAVTYFQKAIDLEPKNPVLYTELGKLYLATDVQKARENFEKAITLKTDYVDALFQLGILYFNNNQTDEAINQFEKIVNLTPNYSNALYSLGLAYAKKGEKEKAIQYLEMVLQLNPGNEEVINKIEELR